MIREYKSDGLIKKHMFTQKERGQETTYDYFGFHYYDSFIGQPYPLI